MKVQTKIIHLLIIIFSTLLILISAQKTSHDNSKKLGLVKRNSPSRGWRKPNIRPLQNRLQSRQVTISEGSILSQLSPAAAAKAPSRPSLPSSNKPPSSPPSVPKTPPPPAPKSPPPPPPAPKKAPPSPPPAPKKAPPPPPAPKKAPSVFPSSPSSTVSVFPSPTTTSSSLPLPKTTKVASLSAIAGSPSSIIRSATTSFYITLLVQLVVLLFYV